MSIDNTGDCFDCSAEDALLYLDPRTPPLDENVCLCFECMLSAFDQLIDEKEGELEVYKREKLALETG